MGQGRTTIAGYTLVELMVALVLSLVLTGSIYVIYENSISAQRVEGQLLDLQDRLRFGMEHLKRDLRRAGFLASPNTAADDAVCSKPAYDLRAVTLYPNSGTVHQPWSGANPNVQPTTLLLFGDFFSGQLYKSSGISGNLVYLQLTENFPSSEIEFNRVFNDNRYLRIVTHDRFELLIPIQTSNYVERTVTLELSVPLVAAGNRCGITGFGEGLDVNVAGFVRYRVAGDTRPGAPLGKTDLIREEISHDGLTVVAGTQLVIADYAVDLQFYDFGLDSDATGTAPAMVVFPLITDVADEGGGGMLGTMTGSQPEDLRFLTVKLTVRTQEEDPTHSHLPRTGLFAPLRSFEVDPMDGAARTLTLASRVELSSLAVRNLKRSGP